MYEVKVQAGSVSLYHESNIYRGDISHPKKIFVRDNCEKEVYNQPLSSPFTELSAGIIAGSVCATFALILAILAFVLWR